MCGEGIKKLSQDTERLCGIGSWFWFLCLFCWGRCCSRHFSTGTVWLGGLRGNFPSCPGGLLGLHVGRMETLGTPAVGRNSLEQPLPAAMWV